VPERRQLRWRWPLGLLAAVACSGEGGPTTISGSGEVQPPPGGVAVFSVLPVNTPGTLTPLGNLAPVGHVLPTDHVYFYAVDFDHPPAVPDSTIRPIYAPTTGTVSFMLHQASDDWKVEFRVTPTFTYYLDHVVLDSGVVHVGGVVHAGDQVGVTSPGGSVDLGAFDESVTLGGFANPARYAGETLHCVSPWKYFNDSLRAIIYPRLRRAPSAADKDGRIDFDVAGHLVGNWFDQSLPLDSTEGPNGWPRSVAFVYDYYDPSLVRISIGGTVASPGVWTIPADAPRPADVTPASGLVAYRLMYTGSTWLQSGLMLVQLLDDSHLRIEVFEGSQASAGAFDGNARIYVR